MKVGKNMLKPASLNSAKACSKLGCSGEPSKLSGAPAIPSMKPSPSSAGRAGGFAPSAAAQQMPGTASNANAKCVIDIQGVVYTAISRDDPSIASAPLLAGKPRTFQVGIAFHGASQRCNATVCPSCGTQSPSTCCPSCLPRQPPWRPPHCRGFAAWREGSCRTASKHTDEGHPSNQVRFDPEATMGETSEPVRASTSAPTMG